MARPILHHRTDEFRAIFRRARAGLREFLKTEDDVLILAASGTGGMEAALVNVLAPGDSMLALVAGSFGERWASDRARARDGRPRCWRRRGARRSHPKPWPGARPPIPKIRAVFVQLNESSTGAAHDVEALARVVRRAARRVAGRRRDLRRRRDPARDGGLGHRRRRRREPEGAGAAARAGLRRGERARLAAHRSARARRATTSTCPRAEAAARGRGGVHARDLERGRAQRRARLRAIAGRGGRARPQRPHCSRG